MRIFVLLTCACAAKPPPPPPAKPAPPPPEAPEAPLRRFDAAEVSGMEHFGLDQPFRSKTGIVVALDTGKITCTKGSDQVALALGPFKMPTPEYAGYGEVVAFGSLVQMRGSPAQMVLYPPGTKLFRDRATCNEIDLAKVQAALPRGKSVQDGHGVIEVNGLCVVTPVDGGAQVVVGRYSGDVMLALSTP